MAVWDVLSYLNYRWNRALLLLFVVFHLWFVMSDLKKPLSTNFQKNWLVFFLPARFNNLGTSDRRKTVRLILWKFDTLSKTRTAVENITPLFTSSISHPIPHTHKRKKVQIISVINFQKIFLKVNIKTFRARVPTVI